MSKFDIRPESECQNGILNVKIRYSARIRMTKNRISNAKIRYSVQVRMSKWDFECQNSIFAPNSNVKNGF